MNELKFPFDCDYILTNKKKIKRVLLENSDKMVEKRIAILGGFTTSNIKLILELFLLDNNIKPVFYESEYNKFYEDAMFGNQELDDFNPDIIYICTSNRNINEYPTLSDNESIIDNKLTNEYNRFESIWTNLKQKYKCPIIQNNFEKPLYRLLGNKDAYDIHGNTCFINRLNMKFYSFANNNDDFYICDLDYISSDFGLKKWQNPFYYYMYKYPMDVSAIPYLSFNVSNIIKAIFGKNKKGMVLDLDNTLWGGVIGDDGVENIALGEEIPDGEAYIDFQKYIKKHMDLGIILNINSKNEEKNALLGLSHPNSVLKKEDFIDIKANFLPKDKNFIDIATELNLGADSLLFIDDNPAERYIVSESIKGVVAPNISQVSDYIQIIDRGGYFETINISNDDKNKSKMYKENVERNNLLACFTNYDDYLKSLDMRAIIKPFADIHMQRIAQLTNKSNQFNLTTKRYTLSEIEFVAKDKGFITLYGSLVDKFGDNGIVSLVIGQNENDTCNIVLWLMSCRVLKRNMEFAMMDELVKICKSRNIKRIIGNYYPTEKNGMVKEFYDSQGFTKTFEDENGNKKYELNDLESYTNKNNIIMVNENG